MRLTLDQLESERGEDLDPFELELDADTVVSLAHPKDLPFSAIVNFDGTNPASVLKTVMGDEAFEAFSNNPRVTLSVLEKILEAYFEHYGLGGQGEGEGSQPTAIGSPARSKRTSRGKATA